MQISFLNFNRKVKLQSEKEEDSFEKDIEMVEKNLSPSNNTEKMNTNVSRLGSGQVFDSSIQIQLRGADSNKINV